MLIIYWSTRADPQSRPVVITIFTHVLCPSPLFQISPNEQISSESSDEIVTGVAMGLAKWIIDDTCPV